MKVSLSNRTLAAVIGALAGCLVALTLQAQLAPEVTLTRLDCGNQPTPIAAEEFSDTYAHHDLQVPFTYSCYLIKHGSDYMIWDSGNPMGSAPSAPKVSLVELLGQLKLRPDQIKYLGISHYHHDHIGQVSSFAKSTLLIGKGDWDELSAIEPSRSVDPATVALWRASFAPWISGGGKIEALAGDKDVFNDGTVVMLNMPGHTPGHHSLLVRLKRMGNVLLSGDLAHIRENYESNGVPAWNFNRADTLASLDRFKQIAKNLKATVIIQHDARDIGKLPAFPESAH
jgi:N-acyl homoserine lactone hydrolase